MLLHHTSLIGVTYEENRPLHETLLKFINKNQIHILLPNKQIVFWDPLRSGASLVEADNDSGRVFTDIFQM